MSKIFSQLADIGNKVNKVGNGEGNLANNVSDILKNIIAILGIACVVVMIIGGVQYMTSSGDASKVEKGKKTILYGLIGLIVAALAFVIVNFVIGTILEQESSSSDEGSNQESTSLVIEQQIA